MDSMRENIKNKQYSTTETRHDKKNSPSEPYKVASNRNFP